ncbi:DUF2158 domain-containing protein [Mucilaginibacter corticis]|uniref:DUF2158 domain-containing protein n=1 Tax=Mucilaginibacter corticis TaxID=2597670 RepID=A0A556MWF8_9SPHI|nr:DUF2158 domain-containing protein [Mucilaginibacter corticis]TSJ44148.1 DUF2158 domain-containing protein [Mucilaginibacter corticis]
METKLKKGDVVLLKSGGPIMTIYELYNDDTYAKCYYFTKEEILKDEVFPSITLTLAF